MKNTEITNENHIRSKHIKYEEYYESCRKKSDKLTLASNKISFLRIISFAVAGLFLFLWYQQKNPALLVPVFGFGFAFLMLIRYHGKLEEEQECLKDCQSVLKEYMARFGDGWKSFSVDGARYLSDDFLEGRDLDLFGKHSLYQYICTASTIWGQDQLALWLSLAGKGFAADAALQSCHEIKSRQKAVAELAQKTEFCMELEAGARRLRSIEYDDGRKIMDNFFCALGKESNFPMVCRVFLRLFPILTLTFLFSAMLGVHRQMTIPLFLLLAFGQLMSVFLGFYWNNKALSSIYQMNKTITPYRKLFQLLEKESFDSPYLQDLQKTLLKNGEASVALKELEAIADSVCARHNIYAFLLCNSLFLHDYHCLERYGKWKDNYRDSLGPWLKSLGNAEALVSLSVISRTRKFHCLPEIVDSEQPIVAASDIRHPLIKEPSAVGNDIDLTHRTCIITGSNMSGKTTFMRSIGVNLALAYAGGFCTASSLRVSLMELCTSIRTEDDVNEGISTFYAELLRIKQMIKVSSKQIPMISLIDEIYKGANSKDRIFFDYKLRKGRCTTTNARYLLRMAGII